MALIGYARVSTTEQHLHLQQDALSAAGCLKIYTDTISGTKSERKGLAEALDFIRGGDTLVVWRLDRLGRSLKDLIERITELHSRNIGFKSLTENIDTTTSGGKLIFHIFGLAIVIEQFWSLRNATRFPTRRHTSMETPKRLFLSDIAQFI